MTVDALRDLAAVGYLLGVVVFLLAVARRRWKRRWVCCLLGCALSGCSVGLITASADLLEAGGAVAATQLVTAELVGVGLARGVAVTILFVIIGGPLHHLTGVRRRRKITTTACPRGEFVLLEHLGEHRHRVVSSPGVLHGFAAGDVLTLEHRGLRGERVRHVERGGNALAHVIEYPQRLTRAGRTALRAELRARGAHVARTPHGLAVTVPSIKILSVEQHLNATCPPRQTWQWATRGGPSSAIPASLSAIPASGPDELHGWLWPGAGAPGDAPSDAELDRVIHTILQLDAPAGTLTLEHVREVLTGSLDLTLNPLPPAPPGVRTAPGAAAGDTTRAARDVAFEQYEEILSQLQNLPAPTRERICARAAALAPGESDPARREILRSFAAYFELDG